MNIQRWTLVVVCAATAMLMLDIAVVNTALSRIAEDLNTGLSGLQWVVDAYTLALASVVLTAGALADRLGRRRLFTIGLGIFTVASLACGLAQDIVMLNSARAVQGVGAAIMFAVSLALLAHAFPSPRERAGALAAYGAAIGASFAVGPLVGGLLTSGLDWQWIFLVNLPIGVFCLWITRTYVEESRDPHWRGIDWPGQITLTAGLGLLVLALLRGNEDGWGSTLIVAELVGAAVALVAFVAVELRVREPMLPMRMFRDADVHRARRSPPSRSRRRSSRCSSTRRCTCSRSSGCRRSRRASSTSRARSLMLVVSGATAQLGAKVPARNDGRRSASRMVAAGLALFTLADENSSWLALMPGLLMACIGTGLFNPALSNVALGAVPVEQSGLAAGVNDTARQAGIAVGVAALGALIPAEAALGGGSAADYVAGLHDALYVGAVLAAAGAVAAAILISKRFGTAAPASEGTRFRRTRSPRRPSCHVTSLAISSAIASEAVAAGDGALSTCTARPVRASLKSSTSVPSRPTAWARTPAGPRRTSPGPSAGTKRAASRTSRRRLTACASSVRPVRHQRRMTRAVPGQRRVARRSTCGGRQQRGRADQHLAGDRAREVHAEERQRRVGHRVDLAAHELGAQRGAGTRRGTGRSARRAARRTRARAGPTRRRRTPPRGGRAPRAADELDAVLALDQRAHGGAGPDLAAVRSHVVGVGRGDRAEVDHPGVRRVQRGQAARRRLDGGDLVRAQPRQAFDAVGPRAALELVQPLEVGVAHRDHELAAALGGDPLAPRSSRTARPRPPRTAAPSATRARSRCRRG